VNVAAAAAPTITQSPVSGNLGDDETLTLQVLASGTAPLSYQWSRDGMIVAGATGSRLTVDGGGTYVVTVSNSVGKTLSAPAIIKTPVDVKGFAGEYRGLFKVSADPAFAGLDHSGLVTVTVDQDGSVSGRILRRLGAQNFTAQSDEFGNIVFGATQQTPSLSLMGESGSLGRLSLELVRTKEGRRLRGRVTSTVGTKSLESAVLAGVPVRSATTAESGRYTAIFQQVDGQGGSYPDGDGYALFTVSPTAVSVTGKLADGSAITASGKMLEDGTVPIFVGLYGGKGLLAGSIKMGLTQTRTDATGLEMRWFKGVGVTGGTYPNGWRAGVRLEFAASKYDPAKGFGLGNTTNLSLRFLASGGGLSAEQKDAATISAASVLTISKSSPLKLTSVFTATSGVVSGTFTPVGSSLSLKYEGVVLQKADFTSGYFIREGRSGFFQIQK
jgi:hypothetical protein